MKIRTFAVGLGETSIVAPSPKEPEALGRRGDELKGFIAANPEFML